METKKYSQRKRCVRQAFSMKLYYFNSNVYTGTKPPFEKMIILFQYCRAFNFPWPFMLYFAFIGTSVFKDSQTLHGIICQRPMFGAQLQNVHVFDKLLLAECAQ